MSTEPPRLDRDSDILREALEQVRRRLPDDWLIEANAPTVLFGPDAVVSLASPQGFKATLLAAAKRTVAAGDLKSIVAQLDEYAASSPREALRGKQKPVPMIVARYLPQITQTWLAGRSVAYADATGNIRIALNRPALFVRDTGATKDPWRGPGRPKGNLTGEPAARVVRALVDFQPPYSVPEIVNTASASNGATYRVIQFLEEQALLERETRGPIESVDWRGILDRWAQDYGFQRTNTVTKYLSPRGMPMIMDRLAQARDASGSRYAVTGSLATLQWESYAPARLGMIYAEDPDRIVELLDLREVESGANVLLARPAYDVVFERTELLNGVTIAAASQVAVDMMTGPGRNPSEGEALLNWMENNVNQWRR